MRKLPAFQFYPGDLQKDPGYKRCSKAERGAFLDFLCLVHECEFRGAAFDNGSAMSMEEISDAIGGDRQENMRLMEGLITKGPLKVWSKVTSKVDLNTTLGHLCPDFPDGMMYSRRMVRDELKRCGCSEAGIMGGGNPALNSSVTIDKPFKGHTKGGDKGEAKGQTGSSSSSSDLYIDVLRAGGREWFLDETVKTAWSGYLAMRSKSKKPMTPHAQKIALTKLEEVGKGDPAITARIIDESTLHNWPGFYPLREEKNGTHQIHTVKSRESFTDRNARRLEEIERLKPAGMDDSEASSGLFPFGGQGNPD